MKYTKILALIGGIANTLAFVGYLILHKFDYATIWFVAAIWAFSNYICELRLDLAEKEIKAIKTLLDKENNERTTTQK